MPGRGLCPKGMIRAWRELLQKAEWVRRLARRQPLRQQCLQRNEVFLQSLDAQALPGLPPPPLCTPGTCWQQLSCLCRWWLSHPIHPRYKPPTAFPLPLASSRGNSEWIPLSYPACSADSSTHGPQASSLHKLSLDPAATQVTWPIPLSSISDRWKTKAWVRTLSLAKPSIC